jgi:hypothetical protein
MHRNAWLFPAAWLAIALLGGPMPAAQTHSPAKTNQPIAEGWVEAAGEVRIYPRQGDLGRLYDKSCISGVMTQRRTRPRQFSRQYVRAYGILIDRSEVDNMAAHLSSIGVENDCNSDQIAIISRLVLAAPPPQVNAK